MSDKTKTLYERLGGSDAITAVANDLLPRLRADPQLGRFWAHRGEGGVMREKQLMIDFVSFGCRHLELLQRRGGVTEEHVPVALADAHTSMTEQHVPAAIVHRPAR